MFFLSSISFFTLMNTLKRAKLPKRISKFYIFSFNLHNSLHLHHDTFLYTSSFPEESINTLPLAIKSFIISCKTFPVCSLPQYLHLYIIVILSYLFRIYIVNEVRVELTLYALEGRCFIQLSYSSIVF